MGNKFEVNKDGKIKAQGFLSPLEEFNSFSSTVVVIPDYASFFTATTPQLLYYSKTGGLININFGFTFGVTGVSFPGKLDNPVFAFSLPFPSYIDSISVGESTAIYKKENNLGYLGFSRTTMKETNPADYVNVYLMSQDNSKLLAMNNPFYLNFSFSYYYE